MSQAQLLETHTNNDLFGTAQGSSQVQLQKVVDLNHNKNTEFTHFIVTEDSLSESFELIKVLRAHQQSGRWTVLIAPQSIPNKALLNCCSVDMGRVLVVHTKPDSVHDRYNNQLVATIENALSQATCSAVVAWTSDVSSPKLQQINKLAQRSGCHFYAFNRTAGWTSDDI